MQLSRFGQGLAVSAVSALVITGLAVTAPASAADGGGVRLLSQQDGIAAVHGNIFIGVSEAVTLAAERLDPMATISFEVNADPAAGDAAEGWTAVDPVATNIQGPYVAVEWRPAPQLYGTDVAIRAVATTPATDTTPATATYSTRNNVTIDSDESPVPSVSIGSAGAFFAQPYADSGHTASLLAVSGTTTAETGDVELSVWNPAAAEFQGQTLAAVTFNPTKLPGGGIEIYGRYNGVLDISGFDAESGDTLAVRAERGADDVFPTTLEAQVIDSVSAFIAGAAGPETTPVTVEVLDESERAVMGAEVRRGSDGALVGYTDLFGEVVAYQPSDTTERYYANTTDVDAFQDGVDRRSEPVQAPAYVPAATFTEVELADGDVFDDQEYDEGDIALQVVDGRGDPFAAEEQVTYTLRAPGEETSEPVTATTDADGRLVVPFDPSGPDGEYTLTFSGPGSAGGAEQEPVTFVAGDAVLGLTPVAGTAPSGGTITYAGSLTVKGRPLAGRTIDLAYAPGTEQAPGAGADAAVVIDGRRTLSDATTTGVDGAFTVKVADLAEAGSPAETGGRLKVTARGPGDTLSATADFTAVAPVPQAPTAPGKGTVTLRLKGTAAGSDTDRIRVLGPDSVAGQRIRIHVKVGRHWQVARRLELDDSGDASVTLPDGNGNRVTRYRVRLVPNSVVKAFTSQALRLR